VLKQTAFKLKRRGGQR